LKKAYQLKFFLPLALRRAIIALPVLVFTLAKNPWRRFCTRREGLYVSRLPAREALAENERICWAPMFGSCERTEREAVVVDCVGVGGRVGRIVLVGAAAKEKGRTCEGIAHKTGVCLFE
jgi:hypothetical protein